MIRRHVSFDMNRPKLLYTDNRRFARGYTTRQRAEAAMKRMKLSKYHDAIIYGTKHRTPWIIQMIYGSTCWYLEE